MAKTNEEVGLLNTLQKSAPEIKKTKLLSYIKQKFKHSDDWLLIFDNLSDVRILDHFLPNHYPSWGKGLVLITTRNAQIRDLVSHRNIRTVEVPKLTENEKKALMVKLLGEGFIKSFPGNFDDRLSNIPPYPMDIMLAGNILKGSDMVLGEYFENVVKEFSGGKTNSSGQGLSRKLMVEILLDRLSSIQDYITLLNTMLICKNISVPLDFLIVSFGKTNTKSFIEEMKKSSLMSVEKNSNELFGNRVCLNEGVYSSIESWLKEKGYMPKGITEHFVVLVESYVNQSLAEESYIKVRNMLETLEKININHSQENLELQKRAYYLLGKMYDFLGEYKSALDSLEKSRLIEADSKQAEQFKIIKKLGDVYRRLDQFDKSISSYEEVIHILKKEGKSAILADVLCELANTYKGEGLYHKSQEQYLEALKLYGLSKNINKIAFTKARIGNLYSHLGNFKEAKKYLEEALGLYVENFGENNSKTSWVQTNLAYVYIETGFFELAESLLSKSLVTRLEKFGGNHPKTAWVYANLGRLHTYTGQYALAYKYLENSQKIFLNKYGSSHSMSVRLLGYLSELDLQQEKYQEARDKSIEVYGHFQKTYGEDHPKTAWAILLMGKANLSLKNHDEGVSQLISSGKIFKKNDHVDFYRVELSLGDFYEKENQVSKRALSHYRSALGILKSNFPETSVIINTLEKKVESMVSKNALNHG